MPYQFGSILELAPARDYMDTGVPFQDISQSSLASPGQPGYGTGTSSISRVVQAPIGLGFAKGNPILSSQVHDWKLNLQSIKKIVVTNPTFGQPNTPLFMQIERIVCPWGPYQAIKFRIIEGGLPFYQESWASAVAFTNSNFTGITWERNTIFDQTFNATAVTIPDTSPPVAPFWEPLSGPLSARVTLERIPAEPSSIVRCTATLSGQYDDPLGTVPTYTLDFDCELWSRGLFDFFFSWTVANYQGNPVGVVKRLQFFVRSEVQWLLPADPGWET